MGADLDAPQGERGVTPLGAAIELGRADLAEALLAAGASADAADAQGRSPAWLALASGQPRMLALLARHQARFDGAAAPSGQSFNQTLACQAAPDFAAVLQAAGVVLEQACPRARWLLARRRPSRPPVSPAITICAACVKWAASCCCRPTAASIT